MNIKKLLYLIKLPCSKCPYKLGYIQTLVNPCPQCKLDNYQTFEQFQKQLSRKKPDYVNDIE